METFHKATEVTITCQTLLTLVIYRVTYLCNNDKPIDVMFIINCNLFNGK